MKYVFIDELKHTKKECDIYGLSFVIIDNSSYSKYKRGFYKHFNELGWDSKIELKGRYSFSQKGDKNVPLEKRLEFVEKLFELSKSTSGKYSSAAVYYTVGVYKKNTTEEYRYHDLLTKIIKTLPKQNASQAKNGKNNLVFFIDNNDLLDINNLTCMIDSELQKKNLYLVERPIFVKSDNLTPGILFADHVAYFIDNYLKTSEFNEKNRIEFSKLINKYSNGTIDSNEVVQLDQFHISFEKETKSVDLLRLLKKMTFVK